MTEASQELNPSELGTHEYWEKAYSLENENYEDHGDVGEVWFGEECAARVVRYMNSQNHISKTDWIIDLGCGNGVLLSDLGEAGFEKLIGVDYSQKAIDLARKVLDSNGLPNIKLQVLDILDVDNFSMLGKFKVAHDKGTYDAISLCPDNAMEKRKKYTENVHKLLSENGFLLLTSCNWTKSELLKHFEENFEFKNELPARSFTFGGQTGSTVTQLVFIKK